LTKKTLKCVKKIDTFKNYNGKFEEKKISSHFFYFNGNGQELGKRSTIIF
jgi:hypothetical protein